MSRRNNDLNPIFVLKMIDVSSIIKKYNEGGFNRKIDERKSMNSVKVTTSSLAKEISTNKDQGIYIEKYKNSPSLIFVTSNHQTNLHFRNEKKLPKGGRCDNFLCKKDFTGRAIGYAVAHETQTIIVTEKNKSVHKTIHVFWTQSQCCNFKCAFNLLVNLRHSSFWNPEYETLTKFMFQLFYPNDKLYNTNDPCILESNGGSICEEEFEKYVYIKVPGVVLAPVTEDYIRL